MITFAKTSLILATAVGGIATAALGQTYNPNSAAWDPGAQPAYPVQQQLQPQPAYQTAAPQLDDQQVANLTASIALYPDPLLAVILPAATYPDEVVDAQRWLRGNPTPTEWAIQSLPYQTSVKALLHYPDVLQMMADHADWTRALGLAFVYQQSDVVNSIQRWRATALSVGTLASNQQQQVINQNGVIQIVPAVPDTVYVPAYDPGVVYAKRPWWDRGSVIRFNIGGHAGNWLGYDLDWHDHVVRVPTRPYWERPDWDHNRWDNDRHVDIRRDDRNDYRRHDDYRDDRNDNRRWDNDRRLGNGPGEWNDHRPTAVPPPARHAVTPAPRPQPQRIVAPAPAPKIDRKVFVRDSLKPGMVYPQRIAPPAGKAFTPAFKNRAQANDRH